MKAEISRDEWFPFYIIEKKDPNRKLMGEYTVEISEELYNKYCDAIKDFHNIQIELNDIYEEARKNEV